MADEVNAREERLKLLLEVMPYDGHWELDNHRLNPRDQQLFDDCTPDDFQVAIAVLEAAIVAPAKDFVGSGFYSFYRQGFNRLNSFPADRARLQRQQEQGRGALMAVGVRLEGLRAEAHRRWPDHAKHGHWWIHARPDTTAP